MSRDNTSALLRRESVPAGVDIAAAQATHFVRPDWEVDDPDKLVGVIQGDEVVWAKNDPDHPHNWPKAVRWRMIAVISGLTFLSPLSSTIIAPAMQSVSADLGYSSDILSSMAIVAFVLGYAVGPIFLSPLSEVLGRSPVYHTANILWVVLTIICARSVNIAMLIVFRFLAGCCGATPMCLFGGSVADCFDSKQRGKATGLCIGGSLLAPALGPVFAALAVGAGIRWTWILDFTAIVIAIFAVAAFFLLKETYPPVLLERRRRRLANETGRHSLYTATGQVKHGREFWRQTLTRSGVYFCSMVRLTQRRPLMLLFTKPACFAVSIFQAINYAILYCFYAALPDVWQRTYGYGIEISGVLYIPLALGALIALAVMTVYVDKIWSIMTKRNGGVPEPEFKLPLALVGGIAAPVGIILFGWPAQYGVHWFVPSLGLTIFSGGILFPFLTTTTYLIDSFAFAASAVAAATIFRSLGGFVIPLFAQKLFDSLTLGWGCTLLAGISLAVGLPVPVLLYLYGKQLRTGEPRRPSRRASLDAESDVKAIDMEKATPASSSAHEEKPS